ncbi:FliM/FliN family flagellar motor switch protein [Novosphingopyxis sp. YJ-S2-01]|uniref:FliM/FliN family flagellar motor switch protein n=1 Tax=Novosphingopyxis sp. YJ-S2-01 TaxID=2794021 RepID=UPI0018DAFF81|nr:FliM/FliN family flagellar motor switch protein [Novosphingopyxis sp. YJ-S2-01]MBH9538595.1 FliM/FliN family flagellar motor switch protein [Novosphingopyxis sp. YJ-S2-01]
MTDAAASETSEEKSAAMPASAAHHFPRRDSSEADVMPIARRTAKRLASGLRTALQPLANERLNVTPDQARLEIHRDWLSAQGSSMGLAFYQLPPMKGRMALRLPHDLIAALVDAFFGGSIARGKSKKADYSATDMRLMHRIAGAIAPQLGAAWAEFGPFRCLSAGLTDDPDEARLAKRDEDELLIQPFELSYPGNVRFIIDLVYPVDMIQSAREELAGAPSAETMPADPMWRQDLGRALNEVFLPVRSVLARPTMTLPELANLKPGDIIPIPPARNLPLLIGDRTFARGSLGEQNGLAAFRIDTIEKGSFHE